MQQLLDKIKEIGIGEVATVVGRYYAMDRDKRWERIEVGLRALTSGEGEEESSDPVKTIKERYEKGENDEFLKPIIVGGKESRIKGEHPKNGPFFNIANDFQMVTASYSSTTDPIVCARSLNSLEIMTALRCQISPTQRTSLSLR